MSEVELLLEPINENRNTLPIVKVDDQIFVYSNDGLHTYPSVRSTLTIIIQ